jgi:hypothetical protein
MMTSQAAVVPRPTRCVLFLNSNIVAISLVPIAHKLGVTTPQLTRPAHAHYRSGWDHWSAEGFNDWLMRQRSMRICGKPAIKTMLSASILNLYDPKITIEFTLPGNLRIGFSLEQRWRLMHTSKPPLGVHLIHSCGRRAKDDHLTIKAIDLDVDRTRHIVPMRSNACKTALSRSPPHIRLDPNIRSDPHNLKHCR